MDGIEVPVPGTIEDPIALNIVKQALAAIWMVFAMQPDVTSSFLRARGSLWRTSAECAHMHPNYIFVVLENLKLSQWSVAGRAWPRTFECYLNNERNLQRYFSNITTAENDIKYYSNTGNRKFEYLRVHVSDLPLKPAKYRPNFPPPVQCDAGSAGAQGVAESDVTTIGRHFPQNGCTHLYVFKIRFTRLPPHGRPEF